LRCLVYGAVKLGVGLISVVMGIVMCACGADEELAAKNVSCMKVAG